MVNHLPNGKAAGDGIRNELIKFGGKPMIAIIYDLVLCIFREQNVPDILNKVLIQPIYKKGDKRSWKN